MHFLWLSRLELLAIRNSLFISFSVAFLAVILAVTLAVILVYIRIPAGKLLAYIFIIPLLIPPYLHAFSWMHFLMFLGDYGLLGNLEGIGAALLRSIPGVIFVLVSSYFPIALIIVYLTLRSIPLELIDAALLLELPFKIISKIILGLILPSVISAFIFIFIMAFATFDVPAFLGTKTFMTQIYTNINLDGNPFKVLYLNFIPIFMTMSLWVISVKLLGKNRPFFNLNFNSSRSLFIKPHFTVKILIYSLGSLVLFSTIIVPLFILQVKALIYEPIPFSTVSSQNVIFNTLFVAFISGLILVILAYYLNQRIFKKALYRILILATFAIPSISVGILFIYTFNQPFLQSFYTTPLILILVYVFRFLPIISEIFYIHGQTVNPRLFEAVDLVSVPSLRTFRLINLPLYMPVLLVAYFIAFWLVSTELPITLLIQPPGFMTLMQRLFIVAHYGAEELMSLLTLVLLLISLMPITAVYFIVKQYAKYQ